MLVPVQTPAVHIIDERKTKIIFYKISIEHTRGVPQEYRRKNKRNRTKKIKECFSAGRYDECIFNQIEAT